MRNKLEEAVKRATDLTVERDDFGCYISVRPYGFLVDATKEDGDKILRKIRMVTWDEVELAICNPLMIAIDDLVSELCGSLALQKSEGK